MSHSYSFPTRVGTSGFETTLKKYSDEQGERFLSEAKNWRMIRFYDDQLGVFNGDYTELFRSAKLNERNIFPLQRSDLLIEKGKLVGVTVGCGYSSVYEMRWHHYSVPLYFKDYEESIRDRRSCRNTSIDRNGKEDYCSAILPVSVIESVPKMIIEGNTLTYYRGNETDVVIPDGVTEIGAEAFSGNSVQHVICPESLKIIGPRSFARSSLRSILLKGQIEKVEDGAFWSCTELEEPVFPPDARIADNAFYYTPMCPHPYGEKPSVHNDDDDDEDSAEAYYRYRN